MINKKNKPASLNISQFVDNARQNIRPVSTVSPADSTGDAEEKKEAGTTPAQAMPQSESMQVETVEATAEKETEDIAPSVPGEKKEDEPVSEENPKRKRTVQPKAVKRDKLVAIRFDKKMHKDISRIKLEYEIDIQDFVYIAVERFKDEFFPNGKASKEGLEIVRQAVERINGKKSEEE